MELPDWLRGVALLGQDGADYRILAADREGRLYILVVGVDDVGDASVLRTDDAGRLITLLRGKDGNLLAVDPQGFLTAVLKGEYAGQLHTISVDSAGRIEAYILDSESQWGDVLRVGNAELAARLGSPRTWDWRGQTLLYNDFSHGIGNALKYLYGDGAAISFDPTTWVTGGYSLKMVGGSTSERMARIRFLPETPPQARIGLATAFSYEDEFETYTMTVDCYWGGAILRAAVRYNRGTNQIQYLDSTGSWIDLGNPYFATGEHYYHRVKVTADFVMQHYLHVLVADREYDLLGEELYLVGSGYLSSLYCYIDVVSRSGHNDVIYLDHYILTVREPP